MRKSMMMALSAACLFAAVPAAAPAAIVSIAGDDDCFGLGGSCPEGTLWRDQLGGVFFTSNATASDAAFTDDWDTHTNPTFLLASGGFTGLSLQLKIAGIADGGRGPLDVLFNGTSLGLITTDNSADAFQKVRLFDYAIPNALLLANNTVVIATDPDDGDGFSIDYASLLGAAAPVPEPATWAFMIVGFGAVGASMRAARRRETAAAAA